MFRSALLTVIAATLLVATGCDRPEWIECKEVVLDQLKAPATAKFGAPEVRTSFDELEISSYVDAENSYGALIRTDFTCRYANSKATIYFGSKRETTLEIFEDRKTSNAGLMEIAACLACQDKVQTLVANAQFKEGHCWNTRRVDTKSYERPKVIRDSSILNGKSFSCEAWQSKDGSWFVSSLKFGDERR